VWSAMVALCGAAMSFVQLLLIRVGVAVGEAGAIPPANSLIADHFDRAERPRAMGTYMLGIPLSAFIGYFGAGWLNELVGWRMMFVILGLPGLVLAAVVRITLKEPRRPACGVAGEHTSAPPTMREVFTTLWAIPTFRRMLLAFSVLFFFNSGIAQWVPTFFIRSHGMRTGELGTWLTLVFALSSVVGIYSGGALATRYAANNERLQLRMVAAMFFVMLVLRPVSLLVVSTFWAFALLIPTTFLVHIADGPMFAIVQTLVPTRMRAMAIALVYLCGNLIGLGLGPLAVGALSDAYASWAGSESLRYALVTLCPGYLWAIWQIWGASRTVTQDLGVLRERDVTMTSFDDELRLPAP
jgi:MFS transporter, Spinster family, sphingosine-1-phosphate transporter